MCLLGGKCQSEEAEVLSRDGLASAPEGANGFESLQGQVSMHSGAAHGFERGVSYLVWRMCQIGSKPCSAIRGSNRAGKATSTTGLAPHGRASAIPLTWIP